MFRIKKSNRIAIIVSVVSLSILCASTVAFSADLESALKIAMRKSVVKDEPVIIKEYFSEDGHWVTESLIGEDRLCITTYRIKDNKLEEISRKTEDAPSYEPITFRGSNPQKVLFDKFAPAVALIQTPGGLGSGIILSEDGLILTNRHVIQNCTRVSVRFYEVKDGNGEIKGFDGDITAVDKVRDLALIKVKNPPEGIKAFTIDQDVVIDQGDRLYAIGHPLGEGWTPTQGVASNIREDYEWGYRLIRNKADVIQFQTPISPGNSGGPLMDSEGNLIGINTFVKRGGQNINFAVTLKEIKDFLDRRKAYPSDDAFNWVELPFNKKLEFKRQNIENVQQCDFENDGVIDIIRFDSNNNGDWDRMLMDVNCDTRFEFIAMDVNEDGYYESLYLNSDDKGDPEYAFRGKGPIPIPVSVRFVGTRR